MSSDLLFQGGFDYFYLLLVQITNRTEQKLWKDLEVHKTKPKNTQTCFTLNKKKAKVLTFTFSTSGTFQTFAQNQKTQRAKTRRGE